MPIVVVMDLLRCAFGGHLHVLHGFAEKTFFADINFTDCTYMYLAGPLTILTMRFLFSRMVPKYAIHVHVRIYLYMYNVLVDIRTSLSRGV